MSSLDWLVLVASLVFIVIYGIWRGRGSKDLEGFLLADRQMRWHTIALSIMATQASAITFLSAPGQGYVDGMRFVQFYLGLPIAMVVLSAVAIPLYRKFKVFTAYEFLEVDLAIVERGHFATIALADRPINRAARCNLFGRADVLSPAKNYVAVAHRRFNRNRRFARRCDTVDVGRAKRGVGQRVQRRVRV